MSTKRFNIQMSEEMLSDLDLYAKSMSVSRSSAICFLVGTQLKNFEMMGTLKKVVAYADQETEKNDEKKPVSLALKKGSE